MIQHTVTAQDLRIREPKLAKLKPNDIQLETLIEKAFNDFCSRLKRKKGYLPNEECNVLVTFLALSYVFESLIEVTDDTFLIKANRYKQLYDEQFEMLVDNTKNELYGTLETYGILK